jgi:hypothetical protein
VYFDGSDNLPENAQPLARTTDDKVILLTKNDEILRLNSY